MTQSISTQLCQNYYPNIEIDYETMQVKIFHDLAKAPDDRQSDLWAEGCFQIKRNRLSLLLLGLSKEFDQQVECLEAQNQKGYSSYSELRVLQEKIDQEYCEESSKMSLFHRKGLLDFAYQKTLGGLADIDSDDGIHSEALQKRANLYRPRSHLLKTYSESLYRSQEFNSLVGSCLLEVSATVHQKARTAEMIDDLIYSASRYCEAKAEFTTLPHRSTDQKMEVVFLMRRLSELKRVAQ